LSQSSETYVRHPIAIAILGYDRPHYLTQVLDSLAPQLGELDQVYLFQDGAWNPHSGITKTDPEVIEECCMVFPESRSTSTSISSGSFRKRWKR